MITRWGIEFEEVSPGVFEPAVAEAAVVQYIVEELRSEPETVVARQTARSSVAQSGANHSSVVGLFPTQQ